MKRLWKAWDRFWFQPRSVAPLVLVRIAFGVLVTVWALSLLPDARTFFGPDGVLPASPRAAGGWSVLELWNSGTAAVALVALLALAGACVAAGFFTRPAAAVVFAAFVSLGTRNPYVGNAGDGLLRILSLYVLLSPAGAAFSVDAVRKGRDLLAFPRLPLWSLRLIQVQVSLIYAGSVWAKLRGTTWPGGTAVGYAFRLEDLQRFAVPDVARSLFLTHLFTYAALGIEVALAVLVWNRRLRPWVLLAGVCLHLGIDYGLRVGFFSWAIFVTYLAFVPGDLAERVLARAVRIRSARGAQATGRADG